MPKRRNVLLASIAGSIVLFHSTLTPHPSSFLFAQSSGVDEPEYAGNFALLGADGKLVPLEKEKLTSQSKTKNHFVSVSTSRESVVPNPSSPVRATPTAHFVVRVSPGTEGMDPSTLIVLKPFVVEKEQRALPMSSAHAGMFQGAKSQTAGDSSVPLTFKKYGKSSLEITTAQPLPPGEYVFETNSGVLGVFCFGVDAK